VADRGFLNRGPWSADRGGIGPTTRAQDTPQYPGEDAGVVPRDVTDEASVLVQALGALLRVPMAAFVPTGGLPPITYSEAPLSEAAVASLRDRALEWLAGESGTIGQDAGPPSRPGWRLLLARARPAGGHALGAVVVAREAGNPMAWSATELRTINTFAVLFATAFDTHAVAAEDEAQRRLDDLVTRVAVDLMQVSATSFDPALEATLQTLTQFFEVDTSFLRRNDLPRGLSVLVAEWPKRPNVPTPDPLGEVPFEADLVFSASRDLKEPFIVRPATSGDEYQERVEQGSGIAQVSMAVVPLLDQRATAGVLGFVKFGDRGWARAEISALQAVASLIVQLQARVDAEERLLYNAYHDELTGLPNRRALVEELARRLDPLWPAPTCLYLVDLDRFKLLNDSLGHAAGDRLLTAMATRLRAVAGPDGFVGRLAADEFVLLADDTTESEQSAAVEDLRATVAGAIEIGGHQIMRTASVGIAASGDRSITPEDLLARAGAALHRAKKQGGNQAVRFDGVLQAEVAERYSTELMLREAIDKGELELFYQPEINLRSGALLAVEALVRWNHPTRGLLTAGAFIGIAEETGLIVEIGRWVLGQACAQMALWRKRFPDLRIVVRVNMSPAQLASRNIVGIVADCLAVNGIPGRLLCLEITEHAVMQDVKSAVAALHQLKSLGVTLAIDDFGTGFSSMAQLKRLPVDALKVDQTFVLGLNTDGGDRAIVDATIRLAHSFGLDVVAEGVESVDLVEALLGLGCYRAQGFLLCRPKPPADLEAVLRHGGIDPGSFTATPAERIERAGPGRVRRAL
jgi:diguanylate cyclase (GGDEF)-like protein